MAAPSEVKGHEATVATDSLGGTTIGKVHGFTFSINNNMVASFVAGSRAADSIKEGNLDLTGTCTLALRDKTEILDLALTDPQADDDLYVRLADGVSSNETVDLSIADLKWNTWDFEFGDDGSTILETASFIAKAVTQAETTQ